MIDAHQHFWEPARGDYGWLEPGSPLHRDFRPRDFAPLLEARGVEGSILVQAAPTEAETDYLLGLARAKPWILGVVGWIDLGDEAAVARIAARADDPLFVGVRPMLQDLAEHDWILDARQAPALAAIERYDLTFDALVRANQIGIVTRLASGRPGMRIVLDHAGKPPFGDAAAMQRWKAEIGALADHGNVACKLSGIATELPHPSNIGVLTDTIDLLIDQFGPDRLLWGSDWPVTTTTINYSGWFDICQRCCAWLSAPQRRAIFGGNARRLYRLPTGVTA